MAEAKIDGSGNQIEVTLTMTLEEAENLRDYVSVHSLSSAVKTYSVYDALVNIFGDEGEAERVMDLLDRTRLGRFGLFEVGHIPRRFLGSSNEG